MGGIARDEKPSQWIARFRQVGGSLDREDIEHWALLRRLPPSLRTSLELPARQISTEEFLRKADSLYVTLPPTTIATIREVSTELASAVHAGDMLAVNAILKGHTGKGGTCKNQKKEQVCWYQGDFGDKSRHCSGPPCPRYRSNLKKGRQTVSGKAMESQ